MGLIGRYIDGLDEEQKDRVVREQRWDNTGFFVASDGSRCLIAVVEGMEKGDRIPARYLSGGPGDVIWKGFDKLRSRFGLDRIVRCVKLRAGASLDDLPQRDREAVGAG